MKNEQIMHLKEERKGIVFCTNENLQQIKRRQENIFNSKQRERMKKSTGLYCLLLLCVCGVVFVCGDKGGWTCESDGWYYNNGKKSEWACDNGKDGKSKDDKGKDEGDSKKKESTCTDTDNPDMPSGYTRTCINGPPNNNPRCWWTYVPYAVKTDSSETKVPLVIDMHGGGGCAAHQALASGFKALSDTLGKNAFITVWPQGHGTQWGSCGSDCDDIQKEEGKDIHKVDDLTFLTNMLATIVKSQSDSNPAKGRVDAERVYATGFSMGCMMSHRLALEKSTILAGFGCHGGTLNQKKNPDLSTEKDRFGLQPMPAFLTGGTDDQWFDVEPFTKWATWNGCPNAAQTQDVNMKAGTPSTAKLSIRSPCTASSTPLDIRRLAISNGTHVMDDRMANFTWRYLSNQNFRRSGALAALPSGSAIVVPKNEEADTSAGSRSAAREYCHIPFAIILFVTCDLLWRLA